MTIRVKIVAGGEGGGVESDYTTPFSLIAAATTNQTLVKKGPGRLVSIIAVNMNAAVRYLKFYDTNQVPVAGTGTPIRRYAIPASTTGLGFVLAPMVPMGFFQGLAFTIVNGVADTDATAIAANDVVLTLELSNA
jgi:hypothetical protein